MNRHLCSTAAAALILGLSASAASALAATLSVDTPITTNAVLQRDRAIALSGDAPAASTVSVEFDGAHLTATADQAGRWRIVLPPHVAGGPYVLTVRDGAETLSFDNVAVGDVWLCSGQSNMEFTLRHASNGDGEVGGAGNPMLRLYNIPRASAPAPQSHFSAPVTWQAASPTSAADFSAACFIMGKELQARQHIPIGLISSAFGGSAIESWISREALATVPRYHPDLAQLDLYAADPDGAVKAWALKLESWLGARAKAPADAKWRKLSKLTYWESWGDPALADFDGIGYYRAHVVLTAAQAGAAQLHLGAIDDMDLTRVNGAVVCADSPWDKPRRYALPAGVLRTGDNIIDVVVVDTGGGGGMWGEAPRKLVLADGSEIALSDWSFTQGAALAETGFPPGPPWLGAAGRTTLYNAMIAPLHGYPLKGFAWYQGEANAGDAKGYAELEPLLVRDWRERFGAQPFLTVQLAGFGPRTSQPVDDAWAQLRDVQRRAADADPAIGLASALDVGQVYDIHPTDKQSVGHRLALAARHIALGDKVEDRGPSPISVRREGKTIVVRFAHGPLQLVGGGEALGFELCDAKAHCHFVSGRLEKDTIVLADDKSAREVRYLWQASPLVNLYNKAGLPATGFALPIAKTHGD
jgi:sialate O-acetylesterase